MTKIEDLIVGELYLLPEGVEDNIFMYLGEHERTKHLFRFLNNKELVCLSRWTIESCLNPI